MKRYIDALRGKDGQNFYDLIAKEAAGRKQRSRDAQIDALANELSQNLKDKNPVAEKKVADQRLEMDQEMYGSNFRSYDDVVEDLRGFTDEQRTKAARSYVRDTGETPRVSARTGYQNINNFIAQNPKQATLLGVGAASLGTGTAMTAGAQQLMAVQENLQNSMKNEVKREAPLNS